MAGAPAPAWARRLLPAIPRAAGVAPAPTFGGRASLSPGATRGSAADRGGAGRSGSSGAAIVRTAGSRHPDAGPLGRALAMAEGVRAGSAPEDGFRAVAAASVPLADDSGGWPCFPPVSRSRWKRSGFPWPTGSRIAPLWARWVRGRGGAFRPAMAARYRGSRTRGNARHPPHGPSRCVHADAAVGARVEPGSARGWSRRRNQVAKTARVLC